MASPDKRRTPVPGTTFQHRYKGRVFSMTVTEESGELRFRVLGKAYGTPSAAAVSITRHSTNGYRFWHMDH